MQPRTVDEQNEEDALSPRAEGKFQSVICIVVNNRMD